VTLPAHSVRARTASLMNTLAATMVVMTARTATSTAAANFTDSAAAASVGAACERTEFFLRPRYKSS